MKTKMKSFTKSLERLEVILERLQNPECDLEESIELLEEGFELHRKCEERLDNAEVKITKILKGSEKDLLE